jgi:hypothetical protein
MRIRFATLSAALFALASCNPAAEAPPKVDRPVSKADTFRIASLPDAREALRSLYKSDLDEKSVKVLTASDLATWVKSGPWKDRALPCEIQTVLGAPPAGDPSPVALDISGSKPGTGLIYVPVPAGVNCPTPRSGYILDDLKGCPDSEKNLVCNGKGPKGSDCRCFCAFGCAQTTNCDACDAAPVPAVPTKP